MMVFGCLESLKNKMVYICCGLKELIIGEMGLNLLKKFLLRLLVQLVPILRDLYQ